MQPDVQFEKAIRLIGEDNLKAAEAVCREVLLSDSEDINMLALLGAILLKGDRLDEAEPILLDVVEAAPNFAKPHQDLAVLYVNRGDYPAAANYFRRATEIDPGLSSAFSGLSHVLYKLGDDRAASESMDKYLELSPDNTLARVIALHQKGDLKNARIECGRLLAQEPENLGAMRRLAMISAEEGHSGEAERMLHRLNKLAPESMMTLMDLANLYLEQHNYVTAIEWLNRALEKSPKDSDIHLMLAQSQSIVGNAAAALESYSTCLAINPYDTRAMLGRGNALRALGRGVDAISVYQQCLHEEDIFADACWSLASMRTYNFSDDELNTMIEYRKREDNTNHIVAHLDFAIGKALDDRGEYGLAWEHYISGNACQRSEIRYDGVDFESNIDTLINVYHQGFFHRGSSTMSTDVIPIFIVGMPRSGSTLLEQILASHPQVEATAELPYLRQIAAPLNTIQATGGSLPVVDLGNEALLELGHKYLKATQAHRPETKPYFIDKLPSNFPYVGFIQLVLPGAVIIDARRQPLDTCVANFRQLFAQGKEFSYDLVELSEMYLQYVRMMNHWDTVLPGKVLTMNYEEVIADPEGQIRCIVEHCGLAWDDACLDFELTERTFSTASSEQVQQPIYTSSIGYWRHYEENLAELIENLESLNEYVGQKP